MKCLPKRGFRRYCSMAISAYSSASWFARLLFLALTITTFVLVLQMTNKTTIEQEERDTHDVSIQVQGTLNSTAQSPAFDEPPVSFEKDIDGEEKDEEEDESEKDNQAAEGVAVHPAADTNGLSFRKNERRLPDALIIGARKGGTRALITFLAMHPKLVTTGDEVQFFNNNVSYAKGIDWYMDQLPPARDDQVLIEKTAEYFHVLWVPERVKKMDPNIKILLVVRDPFIRMVSDYNFLRRFASNNIVEGYDFPELKFSIEELAIDNKTNSINRAYGGLHRSKYYKFYDNWLQHFPKEQIHVINGDRLASENPSFELAKVEHFLGIDEFFTEEFFYKDEEKGFFCITDVGCLGKEKGHKQPEFDPEFVRKVRSFLRPLNMLFYSQVGHDFGWE